MPHALVRRPGPRLADGLLTHQARVPVDVELAERQWQRYVEALRSAGWDVTEVDPADDCADAVFVEDALVLFGDLAVVTLPGAPSRRPETEAAERAAAQLGLTVARITQPATLDGGDVLKIDRTAYVGVGGRTDHAAVEQLTSLLEPRGWTVVGVPISKVLHLKSAVTALPDGTVIGHPDFVDDPSVFPKFAEVPEPSGSHVVLLDERRLLMAADAPRSAERFRSMGYDVVEVDISEFEKLEGCVTCLSVRHRG
ncbi:MAG: arginine deiminase family protein [Ilumatobacteraceae bacterium]|nr:arginine deiminase family protein [Ilumatobacteraceae bacterium]